MKKEEPKNKSKHGMQSYVNYLLADICEAEGNENDREYKFVEETDWMDHFAEMESLVLDEPTNTFGQICGLMKEQFPQAGQLSSRQIKQINQAFYKLLSSWNLGVDFPKKLPLERQYHFLVRLLEEKTHIMKSGFAYFEFCTCDPDSCPFEKYCSCRDMLDKGIKEEDKGESGSTSKQTSKQ